jgi:SpoVK/Ycf46/Vps4 family AAA+-type ATPase
MASSDLDAHDELPPAVRERLREIAKGIPVRASERDAGVTVLFVGGEGSGRAAGMGAFADELGLKIYRVYMDRVVRRSIGETEKNLNKVFSAGERSNVILFFDEADALFGARTHLKDSHDRYANLEAAFVRTLTKGYKGVVILATNRPEELSDALAACVDHRIEVLNHAAGADR